MKITPVGKKLLVLPIESQESKSSGGIVIPTSVAEANLKEAEVVEVSAEISIRYKPGDKILYPSKAGLGQEYNGKFHLWLREDLDEVWGVLSKKK